MRSILLILLLAVPLCADEFSYVYAVPGEGEHVSISRGDLKEVLRLRQRLSGTFLWAKVGGREYVIRDAGVLQDVELAFGPLRALHPEQEALRARMRRIEEREERLEREADALSDSEIRLTAIQSARLDELRRALREISEELRPLESEERQLDQREESLDVVFDAEMERIVRRSIRSGTAERLR